MKFCRIAYLVLAACSYSAAPASSQTTQPLTNPDQFSEAYLGAAQVSSAGILVGYSIGSNVNWKSNEIPVAVSPGFQGDLCLRASSLDGRFWSLNPYRITTITTETHLGPVSKRFMKTLRKMPDSYMAFRVAERGVSGCDDVSSSRFYPVSGTKNGTLEFLINSSSRKSYARLRFSDGSISAVTACATIDEVIPVAADRRCLIATDRSNTDAQIEFAFVGTSGQPELIEFDIRIP